MDWISLASIIIALLLVGLFAGIEIAFISVSRLTIELKKKQGTYSGKTWASFLEKPSRFIGAILLWVNLFMVIFVLLFSQLLQSVWHFWSIENPYLKLAVETFMAAFILILFEFIFKAFFRANGNSILSNGFITFIASAAYSLFGGIAAGFIHLSEWILKYIFNVKLPGKKEAFVKVDIDHYLQQLKMKESEDNVEMNNEIFENVLSLAETRIRECLIPRKEIVSVDFNSSIEEIKEKFIETKLSKLIVFEENIDNIKGYIHQLDLFKNPATLQEILLPIPSIPTSMNATVLINKFTKERKSIAWVIDEFGGTAGIVTMEDLLEEIFGDIYDEYDVAEEFLDKQIAPNEFILSGRLELDYLADKYKLHFRKVEDTETLSGYIINQHESIPRQRDRIIIDDYQFDILSLTETRIDTVKLKILR